MDAERIRNDYMRLNDIVRASLARQTSALRGAAALRARGLSYPALPAPDVKLVSLAAQAERGMAPVNQLRRDLEVLACRW